jgi:hypothetical protein
MFINIQFECDKYPQFDSILIVPLVLEHPFDE